MKSSESAPVTCIRDMVQADIERCVFIERRAASFGWNEKKLHDSLLAGYQGTVLVADDGIAGYCVAMELPFEMQILNLVIDRCSQGKRFGTRLLCYLIENAKQAGMAEIWLEVRATNCSAISLYRSAGFDFFGTRKNYYPTAEAREDALIMRKPLAG